MYRPRPLAPDGFSHAIFHCVSRVVNRAQVLGDREKSQFLLYMRLYAKLLGLRVLTFCLMDDHFHVLVEVPPRPEVLPTNDELIALVRETLGEERADNLAHSIALWEDQGNGEAIEEERQRWFRRMWGLAAFMKVLKQRFSQWFNATRPSRRTGTLWEAQYRSLLVENEVALRTVAAAIDLTPLAAGKVCDAEDYRWSGFGQACAGQADAQIGLRWLAERAVADHGVATDTPIDTVLGWYRGRLLEPVRYAMISRIGVPWSISRRLRPGISSVRESRPS